MKEALIGLVILSTVCFSVERDEEGKTAVNKYLHSQAECSQLFKCK